MIFGATLPILAVLVAVGFQRSRTSDAPVTNVDRLLVALIVLAAILPAIVIRGASQRFDVAPWYESAAVVAITTVAGCIPLGIAMLVHRWRAGKWWTGN